MTEQQLDVFADEDLSQLITGLEGLASEQRNDVIKRVPAMLQSLIALFKADLTGTVNDPEKHAQRLVVLLAHYLGGAHTYMPRNDKLKKMLRDIEIYNAHNKGASVKALALKHTLTDVQIYSVIREQTAAERARRQLGLF